MPFLTPDLPTFFYEDKSRFWYWQLLLPRARTNNFTRSIQAQIRDPLWMLMRQWQLGEFQGEDTGSPINARLETITTKLSRLGLSIANSQVEWIKSRNSIPLETLIERESLYWDFIDWRTRIQIGQQFEREIRTQTSISKTKSSKMAGEIIDKFRNEFPVKKPADFNLEDLDEETEQFLNVVSGRAIDGGALFQKLGMMFENPIIPAELLEKFSQNEQNVVVTSIKSINEWFKSLYSQPTKHNEVEIPVYQAWRNEKLEYEFHVSAPEGKNKQIVLNVREYNSGDLDWYNFTIHSDPKARLGQDGYFINEEEKEEENYVENESIEFIPSEITYHGMPNHRWWEFEDQKTDFGDPDFSTTDLAKLLVMEFALIYGNDWFLIPVPLSIGSLCRVKSLNVSDVFGVTIPIKRAVSGDGEKWEQVWDMFSLSVEPSQQISIENPNQNQIIKSGNFLFLPPTLGYREESPPIEEIRFLRDEMSNMVWSVEHIIANGLRDPVPGYQAFQERLLKSQKHRYRLAIAQITKIVEKLGDIGKEADKAIHAAVNALTFETIKTHTEKALHLIKEIKSIEEEENKIVINAQKEAAEIADSLGLKELDTSSILNYRLASIVPENWIPFIPVHTDMDKRTIKFKQAMMIRNLNDEDPIPIESKTRLLRPINTINEETVSRSGLNVQLTIQRTRWFDGSTYLWIGRKTGPGKGEGSSGLKFDLLLERKGET